jgi:DNA-binding MarR family transcriptional regulator
MKGALPRFHPVLHAARLISEKLQSDLANFEVTATQGRVLNVIDRLNDPVPARVGAALNLTASAMSQMVKRLRAAQLIEPSSQTNSRAYAQPLVLSETGKSMLRQVRHAEAQLDQHLVEIIGEKALIALSLTSHDIIQGLGDKPPFPKPHRTRTKAK